MGLGEFEIIRRYFERRGGAARVARSESAMGSAQHRQSVLIGIGDDAAVIDVDAPLVVTTDTLVAGVHFLDGAPPDALGHRVLAVSLSDLAAMGAEPRWATLALTLPPSDESWFADFAEGFFALADRHGVALIGGNLTRGPLTLTVQLLGTAPGGRYLTRSGGSAGEDVYVTGSLGDAAAGLVLLRERSAGTAEGAHLCERFLRPTARVAAGQALLGLATAAIDVSDGLLADLGHLCRASGCGAEVEVERLPLSEELLSVFPRETAEAYALGGGDDYELCFAAPAERRAQIEAAMQACETPVQRVGRLVAGTGVASLRRGQPFASATRGFTHF